MMNFDTVNGSAFIDTAMIVGVEQAGDDVRIMLRGGHTIIATDAKVRWIAECIRDHTN